MFKQLQSEFIISKVFPNIQILTCFLMILIIVLLVVTCLCDYQSYDTVMGQVVYQDGKYNVQLPIPLSDLEYYHNNDYILLDNQKYPYRILDIDSQLFLDDKLINYKNVMITFDLPSKYQINNYLIKIQKPKEKKKIIGYLLDNL